jgi:hypothetical protein
VDDTFIIWDLWSWQDDRLHWLLARVLPEHSVHHADGHVPFQDKDLYIYREPTGSLVHKEYCKPTHSNFYLNFGSHHHPPNKYAVLFKLVQRITALCNHDNLHDGPSQIQSLSCLISGQTSTLLAGCCPGTTSSQLTFCQGTSPTSFFDT